ncbi:MAG: alpha/beta hydrolase [Pseudomonadota bacterium]|jgi:pimeloyl-ACP methyl ester carboxylesterase|nr:alpha/beta hydrolase [Syntrophaceae bacterium]MDI9556336.1 alpha/beta hydrolase [Pseudomonadota bacterium]NLX30488.1 alpha/beta hydrolase [Deltaproteobacteria bacterium]HNU85581.1 alpha/beta hydrolase [Syntrophales bacterium]HNZ34804.1 alpha/beta hydrolase [Syntrophales bacterium]
MGVSRKSFQIQAAGRRLHAERLDPDPVNAGADGATLVFLHEGLGSIGQWRDFPLRLSERTGLPALVYDRWGYGNSEPFTLPRSARYLHDEALSGLPDVLDACNIGSAVLVGHSDGGSIALIYASAHPRGVRAVITEAAHVFVEDVTIEGIREAVELYASTDLGERLARYHGNKTDLVFRGWADTWLSPEFRSWNIEEFLPGVRCPVLVIQGTGDRYGTPAQVRAIERQISGRAETMLVRCGHVPHAEARDEVLEAMAGFISETLGRR